MNACGCPLSGVDAGTARCRSECGQELHTDVWMGAGNIT